MPLSRIAIASADICSSATVAAGVGVDHPVDLAVGQLAAVALGEDDLDGVVLMHVLPPTGTLTEPAQHERAPALRLAGERQVGEGRPAAQPRDSASSIRASGAPRQKCTPAPKARCGLGSRSTSKLVGAGRRPPGRGWPRRAARRSSAPARRRRRRPRRPRSRCARRAAGRSRSAASPRPCSGTSAPGRRPRSQHRDQPVAEDVDRRLVAGVEQQHDRRDHLVVGELGRDQVADQVVAQASPALGDQLADQRRRSRSAAATAASTTAGDGSTSYIRTIACDQSRRSWACETRHAEQLGDHQHRQRLGVRRR